MPSEEPAAMDIGILRPSQIPTLAVKPRDRALASQSQTSRTSFPPHRAKTKRWGSSLRARVTHSASHSRTDTRLAQSSIE